MNRPHPMEHADRYADEPYDGSNGNSFATEVHMNDIVEHKRKPMPQCSICGTRMLVHRTLEDGAEVCANQEVCKTTARFYQHQEEQRNQWSKYDN